MYLFYNANHLRRLRNLRKTTVSLPLFSGGGGGGTTGIVGTLSGSGWGQELGPSNQAGAWYLYLPRKGVGYDSFV